MEINFSLLSRTSERRKTDHKILTNRRDAVKQGATQLFLPYLNPLIIRAPQWAEDHHKYGLVCQFCLLAGHEVTECWQHTPTVKSIMSIRKAYNYVTKNIHEIIQKLQQITFDHSPKVYQPSGLSFDYETIKLFVWLQVQENQMNLILKEIEYLLDCFPKWMLTFSLRDKIILTEPFATTLCDLKDALQNRQELRDKHLKSGSYTKTAVSLHVKHRTKMLGINRLSQQTYQNFQRAQELRTWHETLRQDLIPHLEREIILQIVVAMQQ